LDLCHQRLGVQCNDRLPQRKRAHIRHDALALFDRFLLGGGLRVGYRDLLFLLLG
jgi:hypothetical protein